MVMLTLGKDIMTIKNVKGLIFKKGVVLGGGKKKFPRVQLDFFLGNMTQKSCESRKSRDSYPRGSTLFTHKRK